MLDDRPLIASQFCQLAEEYDRRKTHPLESCNTDDRAGKLVIAAFHRGYLADIHALGALVDWVENPPPQPPNAQCTLHPCPSNLFVELCGNHQLLGQKQPDGTWKIVADRTHGGILPAEFPDLLPGHKVGAQTEEISQNRQRAVICRWLAAMAEHSPQDSFEARDSWIYYEAKRGTTWPAIRQGVMENAEWEQLDSSNGAKDAARRYAEKHGLPLIPTRPSGRPKNTK